MSLFKDLVEGVASGLASAVADRPSVKSAGDVLTKCCQQLGWSIDERISVTEVNLHFKDPLLDIRKVLVTLGDQGTIVGFMVLSSVAIQAQQVPADVLGYLLERNCEPLIAWQMCIRDSGEVAFALSHCAIAAGLEPGVFKLICETMVEEVYRFDVKMDNAGLLR